MALREFFVTPAGLALIGLSIVLASFFVTFALTRIWIEVANRTGLVGKNMHDPKKRLVPEGGGIAVVMGATFAILAYIFVKTFVFRAEANLETFALLTTFLMAGFIGFVDDMLGWKVGLKQLHKIFLTVPISFPLIVISAGNSAISLPFAGRVDFGILFPLVILPLALTFVSNNFNMLGGLNGLEAGMGALITGVLGLVAFVKGQLWLTTLAFAIAAALLAFLFFNKYPAKIFPGNSLTYPVGASIAGIAILGQFESIAAAMFSIYIAEFAIKARRRFKSECFLVVRPDKSLAAPKEAGSLTHVVGKGLSKILKKVYEQDIVATFWAAQAALSAGVLIFML